MSLLVPHCAGGSDTRPLKIAARLCAAPALRRPSLGQSQIGEPQLRRWSLWLVMVLIVCGSSAGCVQRRLTIRTNPPGAMVYVDDHEIGVTPVSTDYIYYGAREVRIVKDGYETLTVKQRIPPPWWNVFPLDFVTENLLPCELRDERTLDYQLRPQMVVPTNQVLARADELRSGSKQVEFQAPAATEIPEQLAPPPWVLPITGSKFSPP